MRKDSNLVTLLQQLSNAPGAPGFEDAVVAVARGHARSLGDLKEDFLRNLYIYRKENTGTKPVLMLDAHSDEVGFMVHSIKPTGCLRFTPLGNWSKSVLPAQKVMIRNAEGRYIPGVIAAKNPHHMTAAEKTAPSPEVHDMVIDIGATSYEEAVRDFKVRIGEPVVPATEFIHDEAHDLFHGKAFDCRIGCAALLEVLRRLQGKQLQCDVVGVLSSQEEMLERGCLAAVHNVKPQIAIILEGCPADDTFTEPYAIQTALKKGPMLRHMDDKAICNPRYQRWALSQAAKNAIPVQEAVREGGGNNAAVIQNTAGGAPCIVIGVPVRYAHSANGIASGFDLEATVQLVCALIEGITPEMIEAL